MAELLAELDLTGLRLDLLGRLLLAALLGGIVGLEREWSGKPAGFRTNLLICVGAALLTDLSLTVAGGAAAGTPADPGRIAAQIVSGIGFLGAGTIIQSRGTVTGLTTAATLWVVAAVGMAVGAGRYVEAVGATALVMVALLLLGRLEPYLAQKVEYTVRVTMNREGEVQDRVEALLRDHLKCNVTELVQKEDEVIAAYFVSGRKKAWETAVNRLMELDGVTRVVRG